MPRPGPEDRYDWRVQCRLAAALQRSEPDVMVYVPSAFHQEGASSEIEFYGERLRAEGIPEVALRLEQRGLETVEQCELATALAVAHGARLVVISCYAHFPRVRYLMNGYTVEHVVAWGTPSAWLQLTHVVLQWGFPVIDKLGLRQAWKDRVARRRKEGKQ